VLAVGDGGQGVPAGLVEARAAEHFGDQGVEEQWNCG